MAAQRILIVDDDELLQELLALHLEVEGYEVLSAPDGRAALEMLRQERPDLILLDLMMPVMDGLRFMRTLREVPAPPPVVVLSAAGGDHQRERDVRAAGAHAVVRKPIEPGALVDCIRATLDAEG